MYTYVLVVDYNNDMKVNYINKYGYLFITIIYIIFIIRVNNLLKIETTCYSTKSIMNKRIRINWECIIEDCPLIFNYKF